MAYIYLITNKINGKQYVGKTENTIDERWKEHCNDYTKERCEKRPLYDAMLKYGIDNFEIKELEYLKEGGKILSDREIYWIEKLGTYGHNGYNATKGGDGKTLYDHDKILFLYKQGYSTIEISNKIGCDKSVIYDILSSNGIKPRGNSKIVQQYDLEEKLIQEFDSTTEAKEWLIKNNITTNKTAHKCISDCCNGRRNNKMYGFIWKHKELEKLV